MHGMPMADHVDAALLLQGFALPRWRSCISGCNGKAARRASCAPRPCNSWRPQSWTPCGTFCGAECLPSQISIC